MSADILSANNIIDMRNKMGFSREDLAKMLGISSKTVARWENLNNNEPPSGTAAIVLSVMISNTLGIPLDDGKPALLSKLESIQEKENLKEYPDTIFNLLSHAADEEKAEICRALKLPIDADEYQISKEYRSIAGHTIGNWFRGDHDMPYKEILVDVANKLKPKGDKNEYSLGDGRSEEDIENMIVQYFAAKIAEELNKLSPEERQMKMKEFQGKLNEGQYVDVAKDAMKDMHNVFGATVVSASSVTALLTGPLTASLFYSGFFAGIWASIFGMSTSLLLLTGTGVGTLAAVPVLLLMLGAPSYKKTIPVTLQLINIRRRIKQSMV